MAIILPIQGRFDKDIPEDYGNAEYRQERELLIAINDIIALSDLEDPVIGYFLDVAYVNKYISVWGTDKSPELTSNERLNVHANAVIALRMSILRKRLSLSLRKFSLALSHSDLYKWFGGINRFALPKVPSKSMVGELENSLAPELLEVRRRLGKFGCPVMLTGTGAAFVVHSQGKTAAGIRDAALREGWRAWLTRTNAGC